MNVPKSTKATTGHYQALMKGRLIFDSHGYVKRMTGGGFNEQQAETLAAEQADLLSNLATRQDMEGLRGDMDGLRKDMKGVRDELAEVKQNMTTKDELEEAKQNMATKQDISLVRQEMETQRAALMAALTQNKVDMIKWMTGYFLSGLALMSAVMTAVVKLA